MKLAGLTKRTESQRNEHIVFLAKKPIQDLWKLQSLVKAQQTFTLNQYTHAMKRKAWKDAERLERASAELAAMEADIRDAIERK